MLRNLRWGVRWGLAFGAAYSAWALLVYASSGAAPFARHEGLTVGRAVAVYLGGGMLAGSIVGMLRPLATHRIGAALVGVVAAIPITTGMLIAMVGPPPWPFEYRFAAIVGPLLLGSLGGRVLREVFLDDRATRSSGGRKRTNRRA